MKTFRWPTIRPDFAVGLSATLLLGALVQAMAVKAATGSPGNAIYVSYAAGALGTWSALPLAAAFVANAPRVNTAPYWGAYVLSYGGFSLTSLLVARGIRGAFAAAFGFDFAVTSLSSEALLGVPLGSIVYGWLVSVFTLFRSWDEQRMLRVEAAELEARFARSRLDALTARLDPHFLFNALNTLSSIMYEDLARTERLIGDLGGLLRAALVDCGPTWTLAEEREHTERFIDFVDARFGDRIAVRWEVPGELGGVGVPRFALQLLVENAVKHNQVESRALTIRIVGELRAGQVVLSVIDDGTGFGPPVHARGGLGRLRETLRLLHGASAALLCEEAPGGGARAVLVLPERAPS